ncbi:MAG: hypothetical protein R3C03_18105 [Pirellulaceae bacterium]
MPEVYIDHASRIIHTSRHQCLKNTKLESTRQYRRQTPAAICRQSLFRQTSQCPRIPLSTAQPGAPGGNHGESVQVVTLPTHSELLGEHQSKRSVRGMVWEVAKLFLIPLLIVGAFVFGVFLLGYAQELVG